MTKKTAKNKVETPPTKTDNGADKIDMITDKVKKYQEAKIEMFQKSRTAILEQQKADLEFCRELDEFFQSIAPRSGRR